LEPEASASLIQKIRNQNYLPAERMVGKIAGAIKIAGAPVEYDELIALMREQKRKDTTKLSKTHTTPPTGSAPAFSKQLHDAISQMHTTEEIRECVIRVLSHPDYPRMMAVSDKLVRNPLWNLIPKQRRLKMQRLHQLDGPSPPTIMHLDMLLIRRNNEQGRGELYTYFSNDWGTNLIHFRPWLPEDDPKRRTEMISKKLAKYCDGSASSVRATPLPGKYAVSLKPHPKYGDLILYVFEFCSVVFSSKPNILGESENVHGKEKPARLWFDLDSLRTDRSACAVNADVIRAIHELFSVSLGNLPISFIE
jgi:hypothetical protein